MTASPYIAVVGGVNIDIGGRSDAPLVAGDSNPGRIRSSLGGVGRNIAHNLALLGAKVRLITALGADDGAKRVEASCADLGIDLSDSLYVPDGATSTYLFLADSNGDMALAMNDMAIYEHLTPAFLETKLTTLNAAALVVLDTNLSAESIRYLGEHCTAPLFADPVSAAKAGKPHPQAKPHGGRAALRRDGHGRGEPVSRSGYAARRGLAARLSFARRGRRARRRP